MRRGFTLIELLVVITVVAVLVGIALPTLGAAREAGRAAVCASNLRQAFVLCRAYADEYRGLGPGLGRPYTALPNWALVVQSSAGAPGVGPEAYSARSILVCPTAAARYGRQMTRTYAVNAAGHAGAPGDPDNFDAPPPGRAVHVRFDLVQQPSRSAALTDSAVVSFSEGPPPTQTSGVFDLRNAGHVSARLGRHHGRSEGAEGRFGCVFYDGSTRAVGPLPDWCSIALP